MKNQTSEKRREFIRKASKIIHEGNGHLEIFSGPKVIENSRRYLRLRTDILQKTVVGCPWIISFHFFERVPRFVKVKSFQLKCL